MSSSYCVRCKKEHETVWGWKHKKWYTEDGIVEGWGCATQPIKHEWTTDSIKEQRQMYKKDLIQPFRDGEFSKEFRDEYPTQSKQMVKEGKITKQQHDSAKNTWD